MTDVTIQEIGQTQDSGDTVFRAEYGDAWMEYLFPSDRDDDIWIHMVNSRERGGMKAMLDHVCAENDCETVRFCTPLSDQLMNRLDGFKEETEIIDEPGNPMNGMVFESIVGTWKVGR